MAIPELLKGIELKDIITDQLSDLGKLIFVSILGGARWGYSWLARRFLLGAASKLLASTLVITLALIVVVDGGDRLKVIAGVLALAVAGWMSMGGLRRAGVVDAFAKTVSGVGFKSSLRSVHSSISFLGIGADKLTQLNEFEGAVSRCSSKGNTCRFILSPPDNILLEQLARRNNTSIEQYKTNVRDSLRKLARLKIDKSLNIEVRFYRVKDRQDYQQFRLMFVDDAICLLSWTVWGSHLGANNPQIILKERSGDASKPALYGAFHGYFEELWAEGKPVDLEQYK